VPVCAAKVPGAHAVQVMLAALVLPVGPPVPAAQAMPVHAEREPAVAACVPAGHAVQMLLQRHCSLVLHERRLLLRMLK
jgi:hypothetical protein